VKKSIGFFALAAIAVLGSHVARAQFAPSGLGPGGSGPSNLTQQPGIVPGLGGGRGLAPGQTVRIALFCTDLFANTPDYRTRFTASGDGGQVRLASGRTIALRDVLEDDMLLIRGRGPSDSPRQDGRHRRHNARAVGTLTAVPAALLVELAQPLRHEPLSLIARRGVEDIARFLFALRHLPVPFPPYCQYAALRGIAFRIIHTARAAAARDAPRRGRHRGGRTRDQADRSSGEPSALLSSSGQPYY
jgi:hypothetical protein